MKRTILTTIALFAVATWFAVLEHQATAQQPTPAPTIEQIIEQGQRTGRTEWPAGEFRNFPLVKLSGSGLNFGGAGSSGGNPNAQPGFDLSITRLRAGGFVGPISKFYFHDTTYVGQFHHIEAKRGTGSGRGVYERCTFIDCNILFGTAGQNYNADQTTFRDCWFYNSTVQNLESQAIDFVFDNCTLVRCRPAFFYVDGGGKISFRDLTVMDSGDVCRISGNGSKFGPENGVITFDVVDYDANHDTADGARDCLVNDINGWYGDGRIMSASNVVFNRRYPGTLLKTTGKTGWELHKSACFNLYVIPQPYEIEAWVKIPTLKNHLPTEGN
jgi:hypothetical protein